MRSLTTLALFFLLALLSTAGYSKQQDLFRSDYDVALRVRLSKGPLLLSPIQKLPRIALLNVESVVSDLKLENEKKQEIKELVRTVREARMTSVPTFEQFSDIEGHKQLVQKYKSVLSSADAKLPSLLGKRVIRMLDDRKKYFQLKQASLHDPKIAKRVWNFLKESKDFWEKIEEPSRESREQAIRKVVEILDDEQKSLLEKLISKRVLFGSDMRNDVLSFQLRENPPKFKSRYDSPFTDIAFAGDFHLGPDANVTFVPWDQSPKLAPMAKLQLLLDGGMQSRLNLIDTQIDELQFAVDELDEIETIVAEEALENGDVLLSYQDERIITAEAMANDRIKKILLPHQHTSLELEISVSAFPLMGIRWSLEAGRLGAHLKITEPQRKKIREIAVSASKDLRSISVKLQKKSIQTINTFLSEHNMETFKDVENLIEKDDCPYPECIIPLYIYKTKPNGFSSPFRLRERYFKSDGKGSPPN